MIYLIIRGLIGRNFNQCDTEFPLFVNKGDWDKSQCFEKDNEFYRQWLSLCREKFTEDGSIWISGTYHNIFSVAQMLNELDFRILNCITWAKTNPPPNLNRRKTL